MDSLGLKIQILWEDNEVDPLKKIALNNKSVKKNNENLRDCALKLLLKGLSFYSKWIKAGSHTLLCDLHRLIAKRSSLKEKTLFGSTSKDWQVTIFVCF